MPKKYKFQNDASLPREYKFFPHLAWSGYYEASKATEDNQSYKNFSMPENGRAKFLTTDKR